MNGRYLLDTNVVIALFANDAAVTGSIKDVVEVFIPSIVIGELYYGAQKSGRVKENVERIDEFAAENVVLNCDANTAKWYGDIKNSLRQKGRPIPDNDIWVAALALQYDLTLISRDGHFGEVENLVVESW